MFTYLFFCFAVIMLGCEIYEPPAKVITLNCDLDKDKHLEVIHVQKISGTYDDYGVFVTKSGNPPKMVLRINDLDTQYDPYNVEIADMNGDTIQDIIVTRPVRGTYDDFEKVVAYGRGDLTFKEPERIAYLKDFGSN